MFKRFNISQTHRVVGASASILTCIIVVCVLARPVSAQSFTGLGIPSGANHSEAVGVSADGAVVVGQAYDGGGQTISNWRWTLGGGMQTLNWIGRVEDVSGDGSILVGSLEAPQEAVRWTPAGGFEHLGYLIPGLDTFSAAAAVNADGSAIVGASGHFIAKYQAQAFLWTPGQGMEGLVAQSGTSGATDVNGDGSVVVGGFGESPFQASEAFRWTRSGGLEGLGFLPGDQRNWASAVSADGSTIVGVSIGQPGRCPFRWTRAGGVQPLGLVPGFTNCLPDAVSGDGAIVVGTCLTPQDLAWLWTASTGIRSLQDVLVNEYGLDLTGWQLVSATDISADGNAMVGGGINPAAKGKRSSWSSRRPATRVT